ncbi:MAG: Cyclic 2, 3-diphosphoglycerate synthetase [Candidatus Methanohalarchaeum thermophilum]|uniref:Cyclic 2,3-diphosphoglycerate synthetase n=1 Tax=Methanohalarchaeum thermophilum TaxID=1903181 RepID=A0A1Q6DSD4_METT1|nr:MAG: Cyclic 2, 3-diphosphoglycerate synthetase [Candidatus Methanohalarchaeum thermophilum]
MIDKKLFRSVHLDDLQFKGFNGKRVLCLVDGDHYPPVVKWTIEELEKSGGKVVALVFLGGTEKIRVSSKDLKDIFDLRVYLRKSRLDDSISFLVEALEEENPDIVLDLSDEPIVDYWKRFKIGSRVLEMGIDYIGSDFWFKPPVEDEVLNKPSISVIGTGKRIGKTAIGVTVARLVKEELFDPVVLCMGRGGPPEPEVIDPEKIDLEVDTLIDVAERGRHAASDYWEDALLSQVSTIGCRRCGGGMAGNPFSSNVLEGGGIANELSQDFVITEGSGPTFPPVKTDKKIVVIGAKQPLEKILSFFGEYRIRVADLAIITMCEKPYVDDEKIEKIEKGILKINPDLDVVKTVFRPQPLDEVARRDVFVATTASDQSNKSIKAYLEEEYGCRVKEISNNLSNRIKLKKDLNRSISSCDILLTEIKAASIDVAAKKAKKEGLEIVFLHNRPVPVDGSIDELNEAILSLCKKAHKSFRRGEN